MFLMCHAGPGGIGSPGVHLSCLRGIAANAAIQLASPSEGMGMPTTVTLPSTCHMPVIRALLPTCPLGLYVFKKAVPLAGLCAFRSAVNPSATPSQLFLGVMILH